MNGFTLACWTLEKVPLTDTSYCDVTEDTDISPSDTSTPRPSMAPRCHVVLVSFQNVWKVQQEVAKQTAKSGANPAHPQCFSLDNRTCSA